MEPCAPDSPAAPGIAWNVSIYVCMCMCEREFLCVHTRVRLLPPVLPGMYQLERERARARERERARARERESARGRDFVHACVCVCVYVRV